ncbi:MAG: patatin-like phospholipase family protein [Anaerovoracaceae bacterium]
MKKLGIVLGAGGMRGVAQVGFLKALYENGMKPDCVAGASSGALIGAAIAAGMEPEYIFSELRKLKVYNILASFPNLLGAGIFSTKRIHRRLERYLGKNHL